MGNETKAERLIEVTYEGGDLTFYFEPPLGKEFVDLLDELSDKAVHVRVVWKELEVPALCDGWNGRPNKDVGYLHYGWARNAAFRHERSQTRVRPKIGWIDKYEFVEIAHRWYWRLKKVEQEV